MLHRFCERVEFGTSGFHCLLPNLAIVSLARDLLHYAPVRLGAMRCGRSAYFCAASFCRTSTEELSSWTSHSTHHWEYSSGWLIVLLPYRPSDAIQMPTHDAHIQFEKWAREYGPIYSLMLGTKCLIVISSPEAVKELLDRRSRLYSHRQDMYIGQTLCSGDLCVLMMVHSFASI